MMSQAQTKEIPTHIKVDRLIGEIGQSSAPICLFFGGVHGNEPSGVIALQEVFMELETSQIPINGKMYGIAGNRRALADGKRCYEADLNRLWTERRMRKVEEGSYKAENSDESELIDIYSKVEGILQEKVPIYLFDLHTTSSKTAPFITVNDSLLNRKFTKLFPLPLILGIEEYLDGPMLSYYNEKGYVSFGFEGGEHYSKQAIQNHKSFIYLCLVFCGLIDKSEIDFHFHYNRLSEQSKGMAHFYEIYERFEIGKLDQFQMKKGFVNFQTVREGEHIAVFNGEEVIIKENSQLFMPLYQKSGNDGYFLIKKTPELFLGLSIVFRKLRIDKILPLLPGLMWMSDKKDRLLVDLKIARFLAKPLLHLMGYRAKEIEGDALIIKNREAGSKYKNYKNEDWY